MSRLRRGSHHQGRCMSRNMTSLMTCLRSLLRPWNSLPLPPLCLNTTMRLQLPSLTASRDSSCSRLRRRTQHLLSSQPRGGPGLPSKRPRAQLHPHRWSCSPLFWLKWKRIQGKSLATLWRRDPNFAGSTTRRWLRRSLYAAGNGWRGRKGATRGQA